MKFNIKKNNWMSDTPCFPEQITHLKKLVCLKHLKNKALKEIILHVNIDYQYKFSKFTTFRPKITNS